MLVVISPAKRLDWSATPDLPGVAGPTDPAFGPDAARLARIARKLSAGELRTLMGISETLATLNRDRFAAFRATPSPESTRSAVLAFAGDTYAGLEARTMNPDALRWAQDRLRILSGLYGLLRPLDRIQPYRLEMGSGLENPKGPTLYDFWGDRIARALETAGRNVGAEVLVNCASQEYFRAVRRDALRLRVTTPVFLEQRDGAPKIVSFFAKKARGAMARFICENRLTDPADLRAFDTGGYRYDASLSDDARMVFLRNA